MKNNFPIYKNDKILMGFPYDIRKSIQPAANHHNIVFRNLTL